MTQPRMTVPQMAIPQMTIPHIAVPSATYRLQFRDAMTFARAAALADYLARLGFSHLYASPLFAATPGSSHGYDAIDVTALEPEIGGEEGFDRLGAALAEAGLGLLLDFVPNHMAAAEGNPWWRSVLEWGAASPFAAYFDIDWAAPKLILPILGVPYGEALEDGSLGVAYDAEAGGFAMTCYDRRLPLAPPSYELVLARAASPALAELGRAFATADAEQAEALKRRLAKEAAAPDCASAIRELVAAARADHARLHEIHEAQVWRLAHWRLGREALTYRRFFEIAELVGLRVEDPAVFEAVHARLFALIRAGRVAGVRLDHIDGLADPKGYLERFQRSVDGPAPCYLLVEKILEGDERLRPDWPVAGTTGYEFIAALAGLFVDRRREAAMSRAYDGFVGAPSDFAAGLRATKREIFTRNLAAELAVLTARAREIAAGDPRTRDFGADALRRAIVELCAALPVYRSYVDASGPSEADRALIVRAAAEAKASRAVEDRAAVDFVAALLLLEPARPAARDAALGFAIRFQQTSGPVMAKAAEDTEFYRYNRLVALNEVGGTPERYGAPLAAFHRAMAARRDSQPAGLSATATHDTKRGEDARARLYVLSEMPQAWAKAVARWARMNAPHRRALPDGDAPEPTIEWLFYQALAGAWPADLAPEAWDGDGDDGRLERLRGRMLAYMEKAVREAKLRTSWTDPDRDYEAAVADFVAAVLSPATAGDFLSDFVLRCRPIWLAGAVNALAQLAVKLAAPGVPDIYQGAELWDLSLVDPDNRAPVDFDLRRRRLEALAGQDPAAWLAEWETGAPKMALTAAGLRARAERPALFAVGGYRRLAAQGRRARHVVAFARRLDRCFAVAVAPRLVLRLCEGAARPLVPPARWDDTAIALPPGLRGRAMRDAVSGTVHEGDDALDVAEALARFPVALLLSADDPA
jgi:(1->4)-alpha-D-glucan 1-alpha-D-glucosylmutase